MKTLYLPLKKEWYDRIERGEKREEYREASQYWMRRLCAYRKDGYICPLHWSLRPAGYSCRQCASDEGFKVNSYDAVCFSYGYTRCRMLFECKGITLGQGRREWGAPDHETFIIKLGRKLQ